MSKQPEFIHFREITELDRAVYELNAPGARRTEVAREFGTLVDSITSDGTYICLNALAWQVYLTGAFPEDQKPQSFIADRINLASRLDFYNAGQPVLFTQLRRCISIGLLSNFTETGETTHWLAGKDSTGGDSRHGLLYSAVNRYNPLAEDDKPVTELVVSPIMIGKIAKLPNANNNFPTIFEVGLPNLSCYLGEEEIRHFITEEGQGLEEVKSQARIFLKSLQSTK